MPKIVLLDGQSGYDVFHVWLERLRDELLALGCDAQVLPVSREQELGAATDSITFGFNLIRKWRAETAERRHVLWMVDPPPYHGQFFAPDLSGMPVRPEHCAVACVDRGWVRMADELYGFKNLFFLPHAASVATATAPDATPRAYETVFLGSFSLPDEVLGDLQARAGRHWPLLSRVIDRVLADPAVELWPAMRELGTTMSWSPGQLKLFVNMYYAGIDRYLRNRSRMEWISSLGGRQLHVFGAGAWRGISWPRGVILHDPAPFSRIPELLRAAKVLVNHSPSHSQGAHERIFDALLCGTAVVTSPSAYVEELFPPGHGVHTAATPREVSMRVADALSAPCGALLAGQRRVLEAHLIGHRAAAILAAARDLA